MRKAQGKKDDYSRSIEKQAPGFKCLPGQTESNQKKVNLKHDEIMTVSERIAGFSVTVRLPPEK